jgi:hypothetical protein
MGVKIKGRSSGTFPFFYCADGLGFPQKIPPPLAGEGWGEGEKVESSIEFLSSSPPFEKGRTGGISGEAFLKRENITQVVGKTRCVSPSPRFRLTRVRLRINIQKL